MADPLSLSRSDHRDMQSTKDILRATLPNPDHYQLDIHSTKKSHARKQPPGHIPRPRNAFILFRSALLRQDKLPSGAPKDHRKISRFAGALWHELDDEQREPWLKLAEKEKATHTDRYYPVSELSGRERRRKTRAEYRPGTKPNLTTSTELPLTRRSSSCPPPGAEPLPANFAATPPNISRDDSMHGRRPSQTIMYHSVPLNQHTTVDLQYMSYTQEFDREARLTTGMYRLLTPGCPLPEIIPLFTQAGYTCNADETIEDFDHLLIHDMVTPRFKPHFTDPFVGFGPASQSARLDLDSMTSFGDPDLFPVQETGMQMFGKDNIAIADNMHDLFPHLDIDKVAPPSSQRHQLGRALAGHDQV